MEINVVRTDFTPHSTIGEMSIDGPFVCYTLEDVVRPAGVKVQGATAISEGRYRVAVTMSQHFGHELPLICNVPNFTGIRIHPGNTNKDTEGCILVGLTKAPDFVGNSRAAFGLVFDKIRSAMQRGEAVWISICHAA